MAPASRMLRGTGRQGVLAGCFALLVLAVAPALPAALGDRHHGPDRHGRIPPAVPIQAPPLAQQPAAPGPQPGPAAARHGRHAATAGPAGGAAAAPAAQPAAPAPQAAVPPAAPAANSSAPPPGQEQEQGHGHDHGQGQGQGRGHGQGHGRATPRLVLPASGAAGSAGGTPEPARPVVSDVAAHVVSADVLASPGAAKKASRPKAASPVIAAPGRAGPPTTPGSPAAALPAPSPAPAVATPAPAAPAPLPAAPAALAVSSQPLTSGALLAARSPRTTPHAAASAPRSGSTPPAAIAAPSTPLPAVSPARTAPHASVFVGSSPDHPATGSRTRVGFVPVVIDALSQSVAFVPLAVWVGLGALALLALVFAGLALARHRHARRLGRERAGLIADIEALEGALLPALPRALGGLALSASSTPAVSGGVGGDFHDAFALSGDRVAVVVGDAAGQGRQALADGQLVRHAVRAYLEAGLDPRAALAMTGAVVDEREEPLFASVLVAVHDRKDGTLKIASAGHEPPILVGPHSAGLPPVGGWSPPLGTGLETGRRQTSIPLAEGSAVCLVTDGVTEARGEGERIGVSRVIRWLSALGPQATAADVAARLQEETDTTGDDVTVCMLRAITPADPAAPRVEEAIVEGGDPTYLVRFLRDCGLPVNDAEEAGEALAAAPDGTRMIASVEIHGGRAVVELAPLRGPAPSQLIR